MDKKIDQAKEKIKCFHIKTYNDSETFRIQFLGKKKGILTILFKELKQTSIHERKTYGKIINELKKEVKNKIKIFKLKNDFQNEKILKFDPTIPGESIEIGSRHPISLIKERIITLLTRIGFIYVDGPEIEDDWHNFTALNIPIYHPSRDMQDTFFLCKKNQEILLRTHTSSVQIRYMKKHSPPFRVLSIGKVYRNETISSCSNFMFHQAEGFYIDKKVSFSDLKQTIHYLISSFFGEVKIRFRPSYFPFTEPSAEVDIYCNSGWLEIMGCGMIDPKVLKNVNIDSEIYSGFAFGLGIERLSLIIYQMKDIRIYFNNDIRFLKQFKSEF
ncbi:phenylalanine--tRNA ligase subunit alpha [Blattabacterium cuenoti]|uniref:phenylalanine--tRNA ligase subunit alpha n=1 Tax=Blattabacterium cuenoti TaxID=1653831 RepID=UPI00163C1D5A|nr:phenylalanine--tRNA ligase subunit alpha [Blattabacterium cuenoti]